MRAPTVLAALLALAVRPSVADPSVRWERAPAVVGTGGGAALATHEATGRLALGDERGVLVGESPGSLRRVARHGPVRDLAFLPDATLLVATERGLFHVDRDGRETDRSPAPGTRARLVVRVAAAGDLVVAASAAGAFVSRDARTWQRIDAGLPEGSADALALRETAGGSELWIVIEGELWSALLSSGPDGAPRAASVARQRPFDGAVGGGPRDVLLGSGDEDVLVLADDALAVRGASQPGWRVLRPALPPGSVAQRLARAAGWLWIATDRGLSFAAAPEGPWERARGPAASQSVVALAALGPRLFAAGDAGLLVGEVEADAAPGAAAAPWEASLPSGPPIARVQRAALAYLELRPSEIEALRRGVAKRGWLPVLDLTLAAERENILVHDRDETFTSGDYRELRDRARDRHRDYAADLTLSWDLGDVAYNADAIDVAKEAREVIELRDDVLDEVNQLYYERRRSLLELEAAQDPREAERLRLRADELAAGLDAWTGGWFGRALAAPGPPATSSHPAARGDRR
ncbi:MAG TPA: hypothetical protein VFG80_08375 [Myxococcota bacterium]|nr:hypothetical protein [Myxococcota bacterium]